jgi:hypothetical protein
MSNRVLGESAAKSLVTVGLDHTDVVRALIEEIDLTKAEAEAAWDATADLRAGRRQHLEIDGRDYSHD